MKKKISVFTLLLSLMLAFVVPVQVKAANSTETTADDIKYKDIEDFMHSKGYTSFVKEDGYYYIFVGGDGSLYYSLYRVKGNKDNVFFCTNDIYSVIFLFGDDVEVTRMEYYSYSNAAKNNNYELQRTSVSSTLNGYYNIKPDNPCTFRFTHNGISATYYSDVNIYQCNFNSSTNLLVPGTDVLLYESNIDNTYTFEQWCTDAGLNCAASSNEIEELYDFSFNPEDYYYIVRRNRIAGSKYTLFLSQVTKEEDLIYYSTNRALADSKIGAAALYVLSGEYVSGSTKICNYVYNSSGGGWLYTDNSIIDLGLTNDYFVDDIGISFSSSMPIVYSSTDIYSDKEQSSVYYVTDTEFKDPFVLYPIISPTPEPSTSPDDDNSSGGGRPGSGSRPDSGGQATGGGGLDFIINLFTMIWTKICSVPMAVDGYSISLQQIIVYGALVSIVGGFIMHFIFGRK